MLQKSKALLPPQITDTLSYQVQHYTWPDHLASPHLTVNLMWIMACLLTIAVISFIVLQISRDSVPKWKIHEVVREVLEQFKRDEAERQKLHEQQSLAKAKAEMEANREVWRRNIEAKKNVNINTNSSESKSEIKRKKGRL